MNNLKAIKRENTKAGYNNKLRAKGFVPAVLYGGKNPNENISVEKKALRNIIKSDSFLSKVLEEWYVAVVSKSIKLKLAENSLFVCTAIPAGL